VPVYFPDDADTKLYGLAAEETKCEKLMVFLHSGAPDAGVQLICANRARKSDVIVYAISIQSSFPGAIFDVSIILRWHPTSVGTLRRKAARSTRSGACPLIHPNYFSVYLGLGLGLGLGLIQ